MILEHYCEGIRTSDTDHRLGERLDRIVCVLLVVIIDGLDRDFGISIGIELVTLADHLIPELLVVLDDAVMNADDIVIINDVGMRVVLGRLTVCCPSRVADTAGALDGLARISLLGEDLKSALCLYDRGILVTVPYRDTG